MWHSYLSPSGAGIGTFTEDVGQVAGRSSGRVPRATLDRSGLGLALVFASTRYVKRKTPAQRAACRGILSAV